MEESYPLASAAILTGVLIGIVMLLRQSGVLSERAFVASPLRAGTLGLADVLLTVGLFILGVIGAGVTLELARHGLSRHHVATVVDGREMLMRMLVSQGGMLPAAAYIMVRASQCVEGGLGGFGLGVSRIPVAVVTVLKSIIVVFAATALMSMILPLIMVAVTGERPDAMAHDLLPLLRSEPWGLTKCGMIATAVVGAPIMEELLFRGLMQTAILQSGLLRSRWVVIVVVSCLFALIHTGVAQWYALPALFTLSLGLGYVYERSGSLYASMLMHAAFNAVQITVALNMPDEKATAFAAWIGNL